MQTRHDADSAAAVASAEEPTLLKLENAPLSEIVHALASGRVTATALVNRYLARQGDASLLDDGVRQLPAEERMHKGA